MLAIPEAPDPDIIFPPPPGLPAWEDIPEEFRERWHDRNHEWCRIPSKWFYSGGDYEEFGLTPKDGVDAEKAKRAIHACLRSWDPSHERKIAGVAFMLSEWFDQKTPA